MDLNILQWNRQSICDKRQKLELRSRDILLLSETWLKPNTRWLLRGFDTIRCDGTVRQRDGSAILVRNGIKYFISDNIFTSNNQIKACGIKIYTHSGLIEILSLYKPPQISILMDDWYRFFSQFKGDFLIGGDFNAHNKAWGCANDCPEGSRLFNVCFNLNLNILNNHSITRFTSSSSSQGSAIDLTITNSSSFLSAHWEVINDTWGSDHFLIKIKFFNLSPNKQQFNSSTRLHSKKMD